MTMRFKPWPALKFTTFALLLAFLIGAIWARFAVSQKGGWQNTNWTLTAGPTLPAQLQAGLNAETKANSNIIGQGIHIIAPKLNLDATFVSGTDMRLDDDVRVASNIKPFVAAAALKLVEVGRLKLDAPIGPFLSPQMRAILASKKNVLTTVTLRQLLSHTSGLQDYGNSQVFQAVAYIPTAFGFSWHWTAKSEVWVAVNLLPIEPVNSAFSYADTNYLLASDMIATATGAPNAGAALRQLLNWPALGADETFWESYEPTPVGTRIARHFRGLIEDTRLDVSFDQYGGGGLVMSLDDLARAHRAVVRGTMFKDRASMTALMQTPSGAEGGDSYGLGLSAMSIGGVTCYAHGGRWGTLAVDCPSIDVTFARSWGQSNAGPDDGPMAAIVALVRP